MSNLRQTHLDRVQVGYKIIRYSCTTKFGEPLEGGERLERHYSWDDGDLYTYTMSSTAGIAMDSNTNLQLSLSLPIAGNCQRRRKVG